MSYDIKLEQFEGPLDLLLHLIKKNEMDIWNIQISQITEQYLAALDAMKNLNLDVAGEFLVMAATLLHIKSRITSYNVCYTKLLRRSWYLWLLE